MNNKGQTGIVEGLIILVLIAICSVSLWMLFKKDSSIYEAGSNPNIHNDKRTDWPLSIHIGEGGCSRGIKETDAVSVNSQVNRTK
jgi:hypothetical protein